ncbi:MAG: hypothetical protein H6735_31200 [Alphaproteobacteria bacterium]|nr:hypothetical protein [Alphaproteobacteria bacterium]
MSYDPHHTGRRIPRAPVVLALLIAGAAIAGTITETSGTQWNLGTRTNITVGNSLTLTSVDTTVDGWYRHPWDDATWEEQLDKDGSVPFSEADLCLADADNPALGSDTVTVNGTDYRTGPHVERRTGTDYVATVARDTPIALPTGTTLVDEIRFLTSGSHILPRSYTLRFHYNDVGTPTADVVIPIAVDTNTASRNATTTEYVITGISGSLTHDTGNADCGGDGGDEVVVFNPNPGLEVTDIEFVYIDQADADAANGWLSGPFAVTLVTTQLDYDTTYLYDGLWTAATSTANAPDAGNNAIFHQMTWTATIPAGSEINIYLTCGNDTSGNNNLEAGELAPVRKYSLSQLTSPYDLPVTCTGRYLQYQVEIIETFSGNPSLAQIAFVYDDDADQDGFGAAGATGPADCNDGNASINPTATEVAGNNVDENCDNRVQCYTDGDNDGDRLGTVFTTNPGDTNCTGANEGLATDPIDCNDSDPAIRSGATEIPGDQVDQNCDTQELCYVDGDNDGDRNTTTVVSPNLSCLDANEGLATDPIDCADNDPTRYSGATEIVGDEIDQNCDTDEICFDDADNDGDRHGSNTRLSTNTTCTGNNEGRLSDPVDCNDNDPNIKSTATEIAGDNVDQNCDTRELCYGDGDNDGDRNTTTSLTSPGDTTCNGANEGLATDPIDCNDGDPAINSLATEIKGDEVDQNCDGREICWPDLDNDGDRANTGQTVSLTDADCQDNDEAPTSAPIDCDDSDPLINSSLPEIVGDNIDQNCDGHDDCYQDLDHDGRGSTVVVTAVGAVCQLANDESRFNDDCDDTRADRFPGNPEIAGNNVDNDCNNRETCYTDGDNDNARLTSTFQTNPGDHNCTGANEGQASDPIDCDDGNPAINPMATEIPGNNVDEDCTNNVACYTDDDNDGDRLTTTFLTSNGDLNCTGNREGLATDLIDCDDGNPAINHAATEIVGNSVDDDCDGGEICFLDNDDDGARVNTQRVSADSDCTDPQEGTLLDPQDCNDNNPAINPAATEIPGDSVDQNCDNREVCYTDADDDNARTGTTFTTGAGDTNCTGANEGQATDPIDCNDTDATISPFATEDVGNNLDRNCDGQELCYPDVDDDGDRAASGTVLSPDTDCNDANEGRANDPIDCDDSTATRASSNSESDPAYIANGVDNNCDGQELCYRDVDNDGARHQTQTVVSTTDADCDDNGEEYAASEVDCNDNDNTTYPSATEIVGNEVDNNCDGRELCFVDVDNDNYRPNNTSTVLSQDADCQDNGEDPIRANGFDCDDTVASTNPGAPDQCGNGVDDNCNGVGDHDGPSYLDDDDDGLTYAQEQALGTGDCDADSDDDTIPDNVEVQLGTNPLDPDTDHDGMSDDIEVGPDYQNPYNTDGDSLINARDDDDDGDGLRSILEDVETVDGNPLNDDSDGDGIPNPLDTDDDGDGVPTRNEDVNNDGNYNDNTDGQGLPDWLDTDDDNDGILTINENLGGGALNTDSDGDNIPNYRDPDDDNDTVPTLLENVNGIADARDDNTDGDAFPNYLDTDDDNDGIETRFEYNDTCAAGTVAICRNVDGTGQPNHLDLDSDDDGFADGDGTPASTEEARVDSDGDGVYDYLDFDSDNDTVLDADEEHTDTDGTGGVNRVDPDDDGDGIPTAREHADVTPNDGDNIPNWLDLDSDGDGYTDAYEWTVLHNGIDEDGDTAPNYVDKDSDGDGLDDIRERGTQASPVDSDGDNIQDRLDNDDDNDNVPTSVELGPQLNPSDQDGDTIPNYLDTDDDNDGEPTASENPAGGAPQNSNTDGDGLANYLDEDDDGDGILTYVELHIPGASRNFDQGLPGGDNLENHLDTDSDADGFDDSVEAPAGTPVNTDGTDTPDFVDTDSDNDLVPDLLERHGDTDGQPPEDRRDSDDDGDKIPTALECTLACETVFAPGCWNSCDNDPTNDDWDDDGIPDYLDADDDNDGVPTGTEDWNLSGDPKDEHSDTDGIPDFMDDDDDNDGLLTIEEDVNNDTSPANDDTDGDGKANYRDKDDDGDSLDTRDEALTPGGDPRLYDWDNDLIPNFLDDDDDNDGVPTECEVFYDNDGGAIDHHIDLDTDNDGVVDGREWFAVRWPDPGGNPTGNPNDCYNPWDVDLDGVINALDLDDDGDGIPTEIEGLGDRDCAWPSALPAPDGLPNCFDTDSDNDTIPDAAEGTGDGDGDGIPDFIDCDSSGPDGDSDLDGLSNGNEQALCTLLGITNCVDELLYNPDHDHDMVVDGVEVGFNVAQPLDTDGDGLYDIEDPDDDGDGLPTAEETVDPSAGMPDPALCVDEIQPVTTQPGSYTCHDANSDTLTFAFGDTAIDVYWNLDCDDNGGANPNCSFLVQYPDAEPNFRDTDDDGDGKPTEEEMALANPDLDGDGIVNWHDPFDGDGALADPDGDGLDNATEERLGTDPFNDDTDHDGISDAIEVGDVNNPLDSDNDQTIDARDSDDDGDNIPTAQEGTGDTDGDGIPDYLDSDSDNDGAPDSQEGAGVDDDVDCDGIRDAYDADDADGSCEPDSGTKDQLIYTNTGCGGCDAGGTSPTSGVALLLGAAILARRRRKS